MPTFRPEIKALTAYTPGRPISEVAREFGFDPADIVKLASNENPLPPFPPVEKAIIGAIGEANRYPDTQAFELRGTLSDHLDVPSDHLWVGAGSSELLRVIALAVGGPGTSAVYAWPSFVIYRMASVWAGTEKIEVPLDSDLKHDPEALVSALRDDTTVVYVCNPNNPTGTVVSHEAVNWICEEVPERALVVVDEAYHEYVNAGEYATALPLALERPNVVVTRTFSKVYGLAALRVGYAIGRPETITELRKAQAPFSVTSLGQAAAVESLGHPDELARRVAENNRQRDRLEDELSSRHVEHTPSQANFVYLRLNGTTEEITGAFIRHGVIIRPMSGGWVRVSVGTEAENTRFLDALDAVLPTLG